jgi:hypothetical protein
MTLAQQNFKKAIAYRTKNKCTLKEAFAAVKGKVNGLDGVVKKGNKTTVLYSNNTKKTLEKKQGVLFGVKKIGATSFFDVSVIKEIDQLKKQYFKLAKIYHPDKGGTTSQFQELGKEYDRLLKILLKGSSLTPEQQQNEIDIDEAIKTIIDNIIMVEGIDIELIGKWLWVGSSLGNFTTMTYNLLNSVGLKYIKKGGKPFMVYKGIESKSRGKMSKEDIEKKYGVHKFEPSKNKKIGSVKSDQIKNKIKLVAAFKKLEAALDKRPI